jgi:hypothetical protein
MLLGFNIDYWSQKHVEKALANFWPVVSLGGRPKSPSTCACQSSRGFSIKTLAYGLFRW